jgi:signal recognition particle subunit SRP54
MGDVVTLVEKAAQNIEEEEALKMAERMQRGIFDYNDFIKQLRWMKRLGSLKGILGLLPGVGRMIKNIDIDDKQLVHLEAIVQSMTPEERKTPELLERSSARRRRIAAGSGRSYNEVTDIIKRFNEMRNRMRSLMQMGMGGLGNLPGDDEDKFKKRN